MDKGGSWGWYCPCASGMLLWHPGWAVQRLLAQQPRAQRGSGLGPAAAAWEAAPPSQGTHTARPAGHSPGFGKGPTNENKPRGDIFTFARVHCSMGRVLAGTRGVSSPGQTPHARTGQGMGVRVPSSCVRGGSSRITPWGCSQKNSVWPEAGVPAVHTAACQGKGHNKVCSRTWWPWAQQVTPVHQTRVLGRDTGWSWLPDQPPPQHPTRAAQPVPLFNGVSPLCPHTPRELPYLGGAELAHADHWFVPEAAAKLARPLAGGDVALGEMSPCVTQHPVPGLVLLWVQAAPAGLGSSKGLRAVQARLRDVIICLIFLGVDEPLPEFIN